MNKHHRSLLAHNTMVDRRMQIGLTQRQLGSILTLTDDAIGNYERGDRAPSLEQALGLELLLGAPLAELYPGLARAISEEMLDPLQQLSVAVQWNTEPKALDIRTALSAIGDRISSLMPGE